MTHRCERCGYLTIGDPDPLDVVPWAEGEQEDAERVLLRLVLVVLAAVLVVVALLVAARG